MSKESLDLNDAIYSIKYFLKNSSLTHVPLSLSSLEPENEKPEILDEIKDETLNSLLDTEYNVLRQRALNCKACRLHETRNNVVFGEGRIDSPLIAFVGEGPGYEEDKQGRPFVGKAGQLLESAITKGLKLKREDVYICNIIKCRPPDNRNPMPDEVDSCSGFLSRQLTLVSPKVIVTLGSPAQKALTGDIGGITKIRGNWLEWNSIKLMPTLHPAYILRNPSAKKLFWEDLKKVMLELNI